MITGYFRDLDFQRFLLEKKKSRVFVFNFPISLLHYQDLILADILKCWPELSGILKREELKENDFLVLKSDHGTLFLFSVINNIEKQEERILLFKKVFYQASPLFDKRGIYLSLNSFNSFSPAIKLDLLSFLGKSRKKFVIFV
jgi:hypothetical protein